MKSIYALIALGLDAARIAFSKSKIGLFDPKSIVQIAGIGTLYGLLFAGLLLLPFPRHLEMQAHVNPATPECSWTHMVVTPGYRTNGIRGFVCYEQYYDLIKCLKDVDIDYRTALQNAESDRKTCSFKCTLGILGGGLGCFVFSIITIGSGGIPCNIAVASGGASCLSYCRADLANARRKAANNADAAMRKCFNQHSATDNQVNTRPNNGRIDLDSRQWRAN